MFALTYKRYYDKTNYSFYCYKFSYFNVIINIILFYTWYWCFTHEQGKIYLYNSFLDNKGLIISIVPTLHIITLIWLIYYFKYFTFIIGTLINVYFNFEIKDIRPYIYLYKYTRKFFEVILTIYFIYIFLNIFFLYFWPFVFLKTLI